MRFFTDKHEQNFKKLIEQDKTSSNDLDRIALFYVIAGNKDLFNYADRVYNFTERCIWFDNWFEGKIDLTSGSQSMLYLGYNLYNGFCYSMFDRKDLPKDKSIPDIFNSLDTVNKEICIEAIRIRAGL